MKRTKIQELKNMVGQEVLLKGYIHEIRDQRLNLYF